MKLLISNDDGVYALGIRTLADTLATCGHEVTVVCPDRERSATGHGLTLHQPIRAEEVHEVFHPSVKAWACSGTPSDCVKLALWALLDSPPDFVLSGINQGANLGTDVLYSGTVSAAMEGVIEEIPSIAFSLTSYKSPHFQPAADFAQKLIGQLSQHPLPQVMLLNVNVPAVTAEKISGVALTQLGIRRYVDVFEKRVDPRGKTYYWLAGELLQDVPEVGIDDKIPTDTQANREHFITITPLHFNLTSQYGLEVFKDWQQTLGIQSCE
jgi:5'-nucleotidase